MLVEPVPVTRQIPKKDLTTEIIDEQRKRRFAPAAY